MSAEARRGEHSLSKGQRYGIAGMSKGLNAINAREKGVTESRLYGSPEIMNVIAISNQKGGTAKTTTAAAFAVLLSRAGFRVHLVDSDPQASLTTAFGLTEPEGLLYQAMCRRGPLPVVTLSDRLSISPCSIDLSRGETHFISEAGREYILQNCLEKTGLDEDTTVILDCPPSLGVLSIGCLTAARHTCVVVHPGGFELRTLAHLDETVRMLNERVNPSLSVIGAVLTNCHPRRLITEEVCREVGQHWPILGQVRADARLLYATTSGKVHHLTHSNALQDYAAVVNKLREVVPWLGRQSAA